MWPCFGRCLFCHLGLKGSSTHSHIYQVEQVYVHLIQLSLQPASAEAMFLEAPLVEEERIGEPKAAEEKGGRAHDVAMHCGSPAKVGGDKSPCK